MLNSKNNEGKASVLTWINGVKPKHRSIVMRIDTMIGDIIPEIVCNTKWHKPSQPLGVPFYGLPGKGWMFAMWAFKDCVGVGFIAGTLLNPEPPVAKMAGPWNKGTDYKARRIDIHNDSDFNEQLLRSWLTQATNLPGWSKIE